MAQDNLLKTLSISAAGMKAQGTRLRIISQNIANANSLGTQPGEDPYRRQTVTFKNMLDDSIGLETVRIDRIREDQSKFGMVFDPAHPSADENGYIRTPNVNTLIEMMDMKEAQRSYEANLNVIKNSKQMLMKTIDILAAR
ncbi:MAG: flagellar basal body rod protein FlgC [Rhodospirillales bacterium]|jgi:flagellar basal-body rod protein FlgC|nr:flagellar basal body rod protein FlgC [Rhodospirillales bacterium]